MKPNAAEIIMVLVSVVIFSYFALSDFDREREIKEQATKELPLYEIPSKPMTVAKAIPADYDTSWTLLSRVAHIAQVIDGYDIGVITPAESSYSAKYPNTGTPVDRFVWQFEIQTTGGGLPPSEVDRYDIRAELRAWFGGHADSMRVRLKGIDFDGVEGQFSIWSEWEEY